ncbi:MAG: hypothetical protein KJZ83_10690 [Burkholderiaceae bacterium]|nr:hypothetical protein [Burkholderiaceae bacterium]
MILRNARRAGLMRANLHVREIDEIKSASYPPASHPFVERQTGTIRRESLT